MQMLTAAECRTNLVIMLVMMQVSKKIPFDNPQVLFGVRTMYLASNVLIGMLYYYAYTQINKKKGAFPFLFLYLA
jgi:hypothetical protein